MTSTAELTERQRAKLEGVRGEACRTGTSAIPMVRIPECRTRERLQRVIADPDVVKIPFDPHAGFVTEGFVERRTAVARDAVGAALGGRARERCLPRVDPAG